MEFQKPIPVPLVSGKRSFFVQLKVGFQLKTNLSESINDLQYHTDVIYTKMSQIFIVLIVLITIGCQTDAECCGSGIHVNSRIRICPDGTVMTFFDEYCGIGSCNMMGCNCNGGCRSNSKGNSREEAIRLYKQKYNNK